MVTVPNYQSIEAVPLSSPAEVSGLPLWTGTGRDLRWTLDLDRLRTLLRPDTRAVVVNFPNNPTGFVPDRDTFIALAAMCHQRGIVLVSDEVYRGIEVDPGATLPPAADLTPSAVSVNVMSKSYGLPGLRVGWVACQDRGLLDRLERRKHYTSICNSGVTEHLATLALGVGPAIHDRNRAIVTRNIALVRDFFAGYPELFEFEAPMGGCVSFPRYVGADGPESFARRAVEEAGVLTLPSSIYASPLATVPSDRIRIGFGRTSLPATIEALRVHLDSMAPSAAPRPAPGASTRHTSAGHRGQRVTPGSASLPTSTNRHTGASASAATASNTSTAVANVPGSLRRSRAQPDHTTTSPRSPSGGAGSRSRRHSSSASQFGRTSPAARRPRHRPTSARPCRHVGGVEHPAPPAELAGGTGDLVGSRCVRRPADAVRAVGGEQPLDADRAGEDASSRVIAGPPPGTMRSGRRSRTGSRRGR